MTGPYIAALSVGIAVLALAQGASASPDFSKAPADNTDTADYHKLTGQRVLQFPNPKDLYPYHAMRNDIPGKVILHCILKPDRQLHDCVVVEESPLGEGFGAARLVVAKDLRVRPLQVDGKPLNEERIEFPMSWRTASP